MRVGCTIAVASALAACHPWYRIEEVRGREAAQTERTDDLLGRAREELAAGDAAEAADLAVEAIETQPDLPPSAYVEVATFLEKAGRSREARAIVRLRLESLAYDGAGRAELLRFVASSLVREDRVAEALDEVPAAEIGELLEPILGDLLQAARLAPSDPHGALVRHEAWLDAYGVPDHAQLRAAATSVQAAVWGARTQSVALAAVARAADRGDEQLAAGRPEEALALYADAFRHLPAQVFLAHFRGVARAAAMIRDPSRVDPRAVRLAMEGDAALADDRLGPAIRAYRRAVARAPWWAAAHRNLGLLQQAAGRAADARHEIEWAERLTSGGPPPAPWPEPTPSIAGPPASPPPAGAPMVMGTIALGQTVQGNTSGAPSSFHASCVSSNTAGDHVWRFAPSATGDHRVEVSAEYDSAVAVLDGATEVACNDDAGDRSRSEVVVALTAGRTYDIVVDGFTNNAGAYRLTVRQGAAAPAPAPAATAQDASGFAERCLAAPVLVAGQRTDTLDGNVATFTTSCGAGGRGGDVVYRIEVSRPSTITVTEVSDFDAVLELRGACAGPATACQDDAPDRRHTAVTAQVGAGTYYLVVDSYEAGSGGSFTLDVVITPLP